MRPAVSLASLVLVASAALAGCGRCGGAGEPRGGAATTAPPPAATTGTKVRALLGTARTHEVKAEWAPAIEAYRAALALWPDAPRTLTSLAHTLQRAGDLPAARAAIDDALARAVEIRAAARAALTASRIHAAQGDAAGAARLLRRAHVLLPRAETQAALAEALARPTLGLLSPLALDGPFAGLGDACAALRPADAGADWACDPEQGAATIGPNRLEAAEGAIARAWIFEVGAAARPDCVLALAVGAAWWTTELQPACRGGGAPLTVATLAMTVPKGGGAPTLYLEARTVGRWREIAPDGAEADVEDTDAFVVRCGVGPSKAPSCTPHVPRASTRIATRAGGAREDSSFAIEHRSAGGELGLSVADDDGLDRDVRALLGTHPLSWP